MQKLPLAITKSVNIQEQFIGHNYGHNYDYHSLLCCI